MRRALLPMFAALLATAVLNAEPLAPQITLAISDRAGIGARRLERGMDRVEFIFRRAGIRVIWWADGVCDAQDSRCYEIVILDRPPAAATSFTLGFTQLRDDGNWISAVAWSRVAELAERHLHERDADYVLGCAIAHELGHAIDRSSEHGQGVMCEKWGAREWAASLCGGLLFLPDHALRLKQRLASNAR